MILNILTNIDSEHFDNIDFEHFDNIVRSSIYTNQFQMMIQNVSQKLVSDFEKAKKGGKDGGRHTGGCAYPIWRRHGPPATQRAQEPDSGTSFRTDLTI